MLLIIRRQADILSLFCYEYDDKDDYYHTGFSIWLETPMVNRLV